MSAQHVFTVHQTPRTATFFEKLPSEEFRAVASRASFAVVAVGPDANISPRFIYHWERREGVLDLFYGDAFMNKTYLNLQRNRTAAQVLFDLESLAGFALEGVVEAVGAAEYPAVSEVIQQSFAAAGVRAHRIYRFRAQRVAQL